MLIANWGNYPKIEATVKDIRARVELKTALDTLGPCIARGLGRSYGDASLAKNIISLNKLHHFLSFDEATGILDCEAGTSLEEILAVFVPRGWFLPVTPGTKFVTVGGAIAADIHGKNHHKEGTFSDHLESLRIHTGNQLELECSRENHPELFRATCGGMGLTGVITSTRIRLKPVNSAYIRQTTHRARDLTAIFKLFEKYQEVTYSVAWIDTLAKGKNLGRSILLLGEHAQAQELSSHQQQHPLALKTKGNKTVPFFFPNFTLNPWSIRSFNFCYYHSHRGKGKKTLVDYEKFFYPLDSLNHWNRIYGKRGFLQYQMVLPLEQANEGMVQILEKIAQFKRGSFLAVLKLFGRANENYLSFPMKGYTLALDFPITKGVFPFLKELDQIVLKYGGRIYLAKDARMEASVFRETYPLLENFLKVKRKHDPERRFTSLQSQRLEI